MTPSSRHIKEFFKLKLLPFELTEAHSSFNKTLHAYFTKGGIGHQMTIARTPEQNDVVERRNRTLVEAARTMLSASKLPLFFLRKFTDHNKEPQVQELVPNASPPANTNNPSLQDLELLFSPMYKEYFTIVVQVMEMTIKQMIVEANITQPSNASVEMPRVESVRPSGIFIKDWVSDDEDIFQSDNLQATDKPSLKRIEFTNARNESVKPKQAEKPRIITQNPKKMAKKSVLKNMGKNTGQREIRPVWNSVQRINHQNKFVPSAVLRSGRVPISAAKQSSLKATTSTSTFRSVNTATHTNRVNVSNLRTNAFHKSHSPIRRPFYKSTTPNTRISNEKVNTIRVNGVNTARQTTVSTVKGTGVTAVKASTGCVWICQISQEISQKRTRERMSDQEAKEIKAEAREIMPQPSTAWSLYWSWMAAETPRVFRAVGQLIGLV
ncbi:ribonuclease H-like domain-containing protein [Tanacetum coccineum]